MSAEREPPLLSPESECLAPVLGVKERLATD
jgi:hypothetical protein